MTRAPYKAKPDPGSFADLIAKFRQSPRYRNWSVLTKRHADRVMDDFRMANGRHMVADLTLGDIIMMRDAMSATPGAANNWLRIISHLLTYAKRTGMIAVNPLVGGDMDSLPPAHPGGIRTWRDDEIDAFRAFWEIGTEARLAFELALCTGAAPVDLIKLGWPNVRDDRVQYRRQKTERRKGIEETPLVDIPIMPELAVAMLSWPGHGMRFLDLTQPMLFSRFLRWCREAGLGGRDNRGRRLSMHGLRKALGRRLAEAGASPHVIQSWLGHESIASVQVYTKAYDRAKTADLGMELLSGAKPSNVTRMERKRIKTETPE